MLLDYTDDTGWTRGIGVLPRTMDDVGRWSAWGVCLMWYRPKRWLGVSLWCPWMSWHIPLDSRPRTFNSGE